jgi:hypothetical protein
MVSGEPDNVAKLRSVLKENGCSRRQIHRTPRLREVLKEQEKKQNPNTAFP